MNNSEYHNTNRGNTVIKKPKVHEKIAKIPKAAKSNRAKES